MQLVEAVFHRFAGLQQQAHFQGDVGLKVLNPPCLDGDFLKFEIGYQPFGKVEDL
jgi:hypothetical protein